MAEIQPLAWGEEGIMILDQRLLPQEERYITCRTVGDLCEAIRSLAVRGAPAIGIAAAMGVALAIRTARPQTIAAAQDVFYEAKGAIAATRPTARNLFWALERMEERFIAFLQTGQPIGFLSEALIIAADALLKQDIETNRRLGSHGEPLIPDGARILTHCNAGALATGGYGTALGVIRAAWERGKRLHVYVDETRPVFQGMRLTAWELMREGIPCTVITDSMAAWLMTQGKIDLFLCGADRIAANGDTANKIGTYSVAVLAHHHHLPCYIAAPLATIDGTLADGSAIPIEERDPQEVTVVAGRELAPLGVSVYNPAFDVTPHELVAAIITEHGIFRPPFINLPHPLDPQS